MGFHLDHLPEVAAAVEAASRCRTIDDLRDAILAFDAHPLAANQPAVPGSPGKRCPKTGPVMLLGKSPASEETARGIMYQGQASHTLREGVELAGLDMEAMWWTAATWWRPRKDNTPNATQLAFSRPFLHKEIALVRPSLIIALGAKAMEGLFPGAGPIGETAGTETTFETDGFTVPVRASMNHAYVMRDPKYRMPDFVANLKDAALAHPDAFPIPMQEAA